MPQYPTMEYLTSDASSSLLLTQALISAYPRVPAQRLAALRVRWHRRHTSPPRAPRPRCLAGDDVNDILARKCYGSFIWAATAMTSKKTADAEDEDEENEEDEEEEEVKKTKNRCKSCR